METTVKELPDSRVRVDVDVDPSDVEGSINRTARQLGEDMKLPGFRKGKVPPEMVVQRLGRQTVLTQALESSLGDWYERALVESGVNPVGDPKLDLGEGRVLPELEGAVKGAKADDERHATLTFPDDYPAEEVAGKTAEFDIQVKEVREKELPEVNDEFAAEASEFDTLDELRDHI